MKLSKDGFASANQHKMLQAVAVYKTYSMLLLDQDRIVKKNQELFGFNTFHGKDNFCTSEVSLLLDGIGDYEVLWYLDLSRRKSCKVLKPEFSDVRLKSGKSFSTLSLRQSTRKKVNMYCPRSLLSRGQNIDLHLNKFSPGGFWCFYVA